VADQRYVRLVQISGNRRIMVLVLGLTCVRFGVRNEKFELEMARLPAKSGNSDYVSQLRDEQILWMKISEAFRKVVLCIC
jgi:hypothetical protein